MREFKLSPIVIRFLGAWVTIFVALGLGLDTRAAETVDAENPLFSILRGFVHISQGQSILVHQSFGETRLGNNSLVPVASISKQFTGFAIKRLVDQKKLSLDDTVGSIFPEAKANEITVGDLLKHRSGLSDLSLRTRTPSGKWDYSCNDLSRFSNMPRRQYSNTVGYQYSNLGYCLLGKIVEKVSGKSFEQFLATEVFKPLGMSKTFVAEEGQSFPSLLGIDDIPGTLARGPVAADPQNFFGSAGVVSTPDDIVRWRSGLKSEAFIGPRGYEIIKRRLQQADPERRELDREIQFFLGSPPELYDYGLGFKIHENLLQVTHAGSITGHLSCLMYYPEVDLLIFISKDEWSDPPPCLTAEPIASKLIKK